MNGGARLYQPSCGQMQTTTIIIISIILSGSWIWCSRDDLQASKTHWILIAVSDKRDLVPLYSPSWKPLESCHAIPSVINHCDISLTGSLIWYITDGITDLRKDLCQNQRRISASHIKRQDNPNREPFSFSFAVLPWRDVTRRVMMQWSHPDFCK